MSDEVEVRPVSVMRRNGKKYNKLLKSQAIKALHCVKPVMTRQVSESMISAWVAHSK